MPREGRVRPGWRRPGTFSGAGVIRGDAVMRRGRQNAAVCSEALRPGASAAWRCLWFLLTHSPSRSAFRNCNQGRYRICPGDARKKVSLSLAKNPDPGATRPPQDCGWDGFTFQTASGRFLLLLDNSLRFHYCPPLSCYTCAHETHPSAFIEPCPVAPPAARDPIHCQGGAEIRSGQLPAPCPSPPVPDRTGVNQAKPG